MVNFKTGVQSFQLKGFLAVSLASLWAISGVMGLSPAWGESSKPQAQIAQTKSTQTQSIQTKNNQTEMTWYGQSAFKIVTPQGHVLFVDPWILNPLNPAGKEDLANINKADLILVTHGHFDHVGQAADIAKKTGARLVTNYDLGNALAQHGGYPANQMGFDSLGNMGGKIPFFNGDINIAIVPAVHSSSVNPKALGASDSPLDEFGGAPVGFVIQIKNGPTLYHTGDTDVYGDMALISQFSKIDLMLACIGDHFTMGPERAALAVQWVKPTNVAPMHYGTFPGLLTGTPEEFKKFLKIKGLDSKFKQLVIHQPIKL